MGESKAKAKQAMTTQERLTGAFTAAVRNHIDRKGTGDEIIIAALGTITATLHAIGHQETKEALAQMVVKHVSIATKGKEWWEAYSGAIGQARQEPVEETQH